MPELGGSYSSAKSSQNVFSPEMFSQFYSNFNSMFPGMMGQGGGMWNQAQGLGPMYQQLMQMGQGGAQGLLGGGSVQNTDEIMRKLMDSMSSMSGGSNVGKMYESIVGGPGNTYIDPMVDAMKSGAMENLDLMTGRNAMDASRYGQGGSSRQAMTDAMLGRSANRDMIDAETMMRGGAFDKDLAMKMGIAQQADVGVGGMQDRLMGLLGMSDQNVMGGMQGLGGIGNLGMQSMDPGMLAMMMPFMLMQMQGNAFGDPTTLTKSSSKDISAAGKWG